MVANLAPEPVMRLVGPAAPADGGMSMGLGTGTSAIVSAPALVLSARELQTQISALPTQAPKFIQHERGVLS